MRRRLQKPAIPPTFPVPPGELARRRRALVLNSPLLWGLASLSFATALLIRHPGIVALVTGACFTWLIFLALRLKPSRIERGILRDWIRTSNARQDRELASCAARLHDRGHARQAGIVIDFLDRKRRIESLLDTSATSLQSRMELEKLVDGVCLALPEQMEEWLACERQLEDSQHPSSVGTTPEIRARLEETRDLIRDQLRRACDLLTRTREELENSVNAFTGTRQAVGMDEFENAIGKLEQELEIAARVRDRLMTDSPPAIEPGHGILADEPPSTGDIGQQPGRQTGNQS